MTAVAESLICLREKSIKRKVVCDHRELVVYIHHLLLFVPYAPCYLPPAIFASSAMALYIVDASSSSIIRGPCSLTFGFIHNGTNVDD